LNNLYGHAAMQVCLARS